MTEETLFEEASSRPREERAAFLEQACAGQPQLRTAVEALLAAHDRPGNVLDRPPVALGAMIDSQPDSANPLVTGEYTPQPKGASSHQATTTDYRPESAAGAVIAGKYTLVEKIGEGGMGEVWVAKQTEPVKRKVALKLIKAGMDSRAVLQRFEQERQALALMDHPNIARVFDGGQSTPLAPREEPPLAKREEYSGQPFFVMELVHGLPLTRFCDDSKLSIRQRLELFLPICQAVQHAHQKGIIHRDLKPANILVTLIDGKGVPKVIDFGVAKATSGKLTDESLSTQLGAVVGTLEYMAPEQAGYAGVDIDTRADVYALGVILYELLTGLRPLDASRLKQAAFTEMIRMIKEEEPSKPSTRLSTNARAPALAAERQSEPKRLIALLRVELDWVVMKCLEKQRDRRYETANGLARDIQRYLANEPVEARPPSVRYRLGKALRRHKGPVLAATLLLLALVGGIIGTTWGLLNAEAAQARAEQSASLALEQQGRAEAREQQAIDAVKRFRDAVDHEPELKNSLELEALRKRLLKDPLAFFRELRTRLQADADTRPASLARLAQACSDLGVLTAAIGDQQDALAAHGEALAIWQQLAIANPTVIEYQRCVAGGHNNIGALLRDTGKQTEALKAWERALLIRQNLADANPGVTEHQSDLAASHDNIGILLREAGKRTEALKFHERALAIQQRLADANSTVAEYQSNLAKRCNNIGLLLLETGEPDEALKAFERALAIQQKLADANPTIPAYQGDLAKSHNNIGVLLHETGKPAMALRAWERALVVLQKLADSNPTVSAYQRDLAGGHNNIGLLLRQTGKPDEALNAYEKALAIRQKLAADNATVAAYQSDLALSHDNIGNLLRESGKPGAALRAYERAVAILQKLADSNPTVTAYQRDLAGGHNNIGLLFVETGKPAEALKAFEKALAIQQHLADANPNLPEFASALGGTLNNLALIDLDENRFAAARTRLRQAVAWQRKALDAYPAHAKYRLFLANHWTNLIRAARGLGDAEGVAEAERALVELHALDPAMAVLDKRLATIRQGGPPPEDEGERLRLAQRACDTALYATAARLWGAALAQHPQLGDNLQAGHRYNAACAAALAGCGQGKDAPPPEDTARIQLRRQALDWLRADLALHTKLSTSGPAAARPFVQQQLKHWQEDSDLIGIREPQALTKFLADERAALTKLWSEVTTLLNMLQENRNTNPH
jgi:serine/threonine-protein kinase